MKLTEHRQKVCPIYAKDDCRQEMSLVERHIVSAVCTGMEICLQRGELASLIVLILQNEVYRDFLSYLR